MNRVTLKHMRYFLALVEHLHFGRAASACAISQPALSLQIKELEGVLGGPMVERAARELRLTSLGQDFAQRAREILVRVDDLEGLGRASQAPLSGRLRLGVIPTVAPYLLPQIIKALSGRFPDLDVQPRESVTQSLIEDLRTSRLDVALMALPVSEPSLREFALFDEEFVLVRAASDANLPVPSPAHLHSMRLLLLEEGHCFRDQALSVCEVSGARPRQIMEGSSLSTLVQMVGAGIGVTLVPRMAVALEARAADVSFAAFPPPAPTRTIGMIWRKSNPLGEDLLQIGAVVRKAAEIGQANAGGVLR